jgi:hypothetical protein
VNFTVQVLQGGGNRGVSLPILLNCQGRLQGGYGVPRAECPQGGGSAFAHRRFGVMQRFDQRVNISLRLELPDIGDRSRYSHPNLAR